MSSPRLVNPYVVTGPDQMAEATADLMDESWVPFPWDLPPKNSHHVYRAGIPPLSSIVMPAFATPTVVCQYQVPDGYQFVLRARMNATNAVFAEGSGDLIWTTDVNTPLGTTAPQGNAIHGLEGERFSVGSFAHGPVRWWGRTIYKANDIIRVKVLNSAVAPGAPSYLTSILVGWIWPARP